MDKKELKEDRNFVMSAIECNADAYLYASVKLKNDKDIILKAVSKNES